MRDLELSLTDAEFAELRAAAEREGMTVETLAQKAISKAIAKRYLLPKTSGVLLAFRGLKSSEG